ncbi:hypothetical protein BDN71DRAFT_1512725 [Pleurotus eryngii]|uniref:Transmembrane protein n=1 Tax=Pleurotus eryngii TaxID=5323 RepID=A0A9P5ZK80_PLEER|nr:hypothetical protein BDN71DRAFT_1512725 [Pleurotus eryngii]
MSSASDKNKSASAASCASSALQSTPQTYTASLTNLLTMRAPLFLIAFAVVLVVASPSTDKRKKPKAKGAAVNTGDPVIDDDPAATP